ncbi:SRPBCC family protein [Leifsonia sp. L25]|uniref:SRPBCC family protein n=1 Tax=Actinomycetes TaxID=1760 RepID=UPI003D682288
MTTYTATRAIEGDTDAYFSYIADPENLPQYFPHMVSAHEQPDGTVETTAHVHTDRDGKEETVTAEARFDADFAAKEIRWSAPGPHDYSGSLRVSDGTAELTIDTTEDLPGIQRSLEDALETIAQNLQRAV